MRARLRLVACAVVATVVLGTPAARAADAATERARAHLRGATRLYDQGRYEDALAEVMAAYAERPAPELQYNLAKCYEQLGRPREAAHAYRVYLADKPDASDRADVEARIAALSARAAAAPTTTASPSTPTPSTATATAPPGDRLALKTIVVYRELEPGRGARFAAYGVGVFALAALASGITCSVFATRDADSVTHGGGDPAAGTAPLPFAGRPRETQSRGETLEIVAGVSYAVAGLAAAGAVGLYWLGRKIDREPRRYAASQQAVLLPYLDGRGAGLSLSGRF